MKNGATFIVVNLIDPRRLLAHLATWSEHKDLLVHSVAEGLRQRILNGEFDYHEPDPIAVSNHEQSEYYKRHPIYDDAGDEYRDNPEEYE
jgi:phage FluMu gp28-like protein